MRATRAIRGCGLERRSVTTVVAAALMTWACGMPPERPPADHLEPAKNLLLIVIDTLRADFVGVYGGEVITPNLDRIAASGIRFERAYSHIPVTGPSHASIFSGLTPLSHGVRINAQSMTDAAVTLAEVLRAQGMRTGGVVSLGVLRSRFGFNRGFEVYDDIFDRQWFRPADEITDAAVRMVAGWPETDRFFAFVHYSDPHEPYAPPGLDYPIFEVVVDGSTVASVSADGRGVRIPLDLPAGSHEIRFEPSGKFADRGLTFQQLELTPGNGTLSLGVGWKAAEGSSPTRATRASSLPATLTASVTGSGSGPVRCSLEFFVAENLGVAESRRRYGLEVEFVDQELGRLLGELDRIGKLKDTVVVVTSDHGEGLGDHGLMGHISQLYDTLLRVPLLVLVPGSGGGEVVGGPVSLVDLRPTALALLGVEDTEVTDGVDLSPEIWNRPIDDHPPHLCMTFRPLANAELRGMISGGFKLILDEETGRTEFYDLISDAGERRNLADVASNSNSKRLAQYLRSLDQLLDSEAQVGSGANREQLTDEERKMLEALGYAD